MAQSNKLSDIEKQKFGLLTVLHREQAPGKQASWRCRCDCGNEVVVRGDKLRLGVRTSCNKWNHKEVA